MPTVADDDYARLLRFRTGIRRFLRWSEAQARTAGVTPAQHQLLLAVRGLAGGSPPTVGELSDALLLRHHSTVGLVDRAEAAGLVRREADARDHRVVRVATTPAGDEILRRLTAAHLEELARMAPAMEGLWAGLDEVQP